VSGSHLSDGTLLGGRVIYRQMTDGYRTGIEPVLLAASIPAKTGEWVVEAGTGAGAGLLCLATRVSGISGLGLEIDPDLARLATANFASNGQPSLQASAQDLAAWSPDRAYDHAFANPPWHDAGGTASPNAGRRLAKLARPAVLADWVGSLAKSLRRRGTLSLILPASHISAAISALERANCSEVTLLPLWPRAGRQARLVILRGVRDGRGPCHILPGLTLHDEDGAYTPEADRLLRQGEMLE
jgi:tRNA1(Val) A37 N6-methylase TrmN6